jgi:DNA mismatch repair protein MutL
MGQIKVLPQDLVNQIAAGEVIERPASVVKELMENSLDAGAKTIDVEMNGSGMELIRVSDDGSGMTEAELDLALLRHATSKIDTIDDLFSIKTLGFRGEALPSILSVSKTVISSRPASAGHGTALTIEAGEIIRRAKKGMPAGTIVEVSDLFFNTPARRKFMKTAATEQRHVMDAVSRYALACPDVRFSLRINGRYLLSFTRGSELCDRASEVLGTAQAGSLIPFHQDRPGITVHGLAAPLSETRSNRGGIYTFVNSRSVKDSLLAAAVIDGYSGMLMKGRYPVAAVFIEIDTAEVDVNVHPSKAEVRFRHPSAVFGLVSASIGNALSPSPRQQIKAFEAGYRQIEVHDGSSGTYRSGAGQSAGYKTGYKEERTLFSEDPSLDGFYSSKTVIGMLHAAYVLLQDEDSLYILDQHAAHERVTFERLRALHASGKPGTQFLLTPLVLETGMQEFGAYEEVAGYLADVGIECEPFGENTIVVRAIPSILVGADISRIIRDLLHEVTEGVFHGKKDGIDRLDELMASIACHASVRAGKTISMTEASALLRDLDRAGSPLTCPHGRPLFKKIGREEIERWIGRRP